MNRPKIEFTFLNKTKLCYKILPVLSQKRKTPEVSDKVNRMTKYICIFVKKRSLYIVSFEIILGNSSIWNNKTCIT